MIKYSHSRLQIRTRRQQTILQPLLLSTIPPTAIELDMPANRVEELRVQYCGLSKLDDLELLYYEAKYSLPLLLQLHDILKDNRITKDKDVREIIELANQGLPDIRYRFGYITT